MMYYMGQYGPILNQPITSMLVNERSHNCNTGKFYHYNLVALINQIVNNCLIFHLVMGKFTEPIYENVPLPWNSKEVRNRASSVQSAPEIKSLSIKGPQQIQPVKEDVIVEKKQNEVAPVKNNLDMNSSSNVSSQITSTPVIHSADQSFGKFINNACYYVQLGKISVNIFL